jgi:hypothetical protein
MLLEVSVLSRCVWRGIDFASSPSIQTILAYQRSGFQVGTLTNITLNGTKNGFGNTIEVFAKYSWRGFSVMIDDYYFFLPTDTLNNYFDWGKNTQHFIEGVLQYDHRKFSVKAGYNFYTNQNYNTQGIYLEGLYRLNDNFSIFLGILTAKSDLNFMQKGGISNLGISAQKTISITKTFALPLKASLIINPNHRQVPDIEGVGKNPLHFVVSTTF